MICSNSPPSPAGRKKHVFFRLLANSKKNLLSGLLLFGVLTPLVANAQEITRVAQLPAWPGVSQIIAYDQRIWFVNSEPYKDTNVADIYSYSPATEAVSYERSLFSQDTGTPVVYQGLLYWPFEDPRRSAGSGEFVVTDGSNWEWDAMQVGSVMHVHAMNVCDNQLVAVTGSWTGQLQRQSTPDNWQVQYDYPSGAASFSRLVNVSEFNGDCIVGASANRKVEPKLFKIDGDITTPLQGWPASDRVDALTVHKDTLFAFADTGNNRKLLEFNGQSTRTIKLPDGHRPRALHSNGKNLWLATLFTEDNKARGRLWVYTEDGTFKPLATIQQFPTALTSYKNHLYIGTYHPSGGALWQFAIDGAEDTAVAAGSLAAKPTPTTIDESLTNSIYDELLTMVRDPGSTDDRARSLRRTFARHPLSNTPEFGQAITRLLTVGLDSTLIQMFTDRPVEREKLVQWYLLTTLAINGNGYVDPAFITAEDNLTTNGRGSGSGKMFEPSIAAIAATGWLNQNDPHTVQSLITRLNRKTDPQWVTSDVIGALTAVTGQRFAYDIDAWNQWWKQQP